jgi:hypothetical protein
MNTILSIGGAILLILAWLYFYGKAMIISMNNFSQSEKAPPVSVIIGPVVYTILGGICLALIGFLIPGIERLSFMGCIISISLILGIVHGVTDYWKLKRLVALNQKLSGLQSEASGRRDRIFRFLASIVLLALLASVYFFISTFLFYNRVNPVISIWGLGISLTILIGCGFLLMFSFKLR